MYPPRGFENIVKLLLEAGRLRKRPVALLLMAEDDVFKNGLGHAKETRDLLVELGALRRQSGPLDKKSVD